jgi:hypothetical protein
MTKPDPFEIVYAQNRRIGRAYMRQAIGWLAFSAVCFGLLLWMWFGRLV